MSMQTEGPDSAKFRTMGASWFASRAYHDRVDRSHLNWQGASTLQSRMSAYANSTEHHAEWLRAILDMNPILLAKNDLDLTGEEVKNLARGALSTMGQAAATTKPARGPEPRPTTAPAAKKTKVADSPDEKKLRTMGASWFVSRAYHDHVDASHLNWQNAKTLQPRMSSYASSTEHHAEWLRMVLDMNPKRLAHNSLGLSPEQIKDMARRTLAKMA